MNLVFLPPIAQAVPPAKLEPLSRKSVEERIDNHLMHGVKMLKMFKKQNVDALSKLFPEENIKKLEAQQEISTIFGNAKNEIKTLNEKLNNQFAKGNENISKHEIKNLKKELHQAEKQMARIIQKSQIKTAATLGKATVDATDKGISTEQVKSRIETLAQGGFSAQVISFFALVSKTNRVAIQAFKDAKTAMDASSKTPFTEGNNDSQVEQDKLAEFKTGALKRRAGVIGYNGIYRIQIAFDEKTIHKQLKEFRSQNLGAQDRAVIEKEFEIPTVQGPTKVQSNLTPLNGAFDAKLGNAQIPSTVFTNILGSKGISSANRKEPHLINGWLTSLNKDGNVIFRGLRHAILSDKYETDPRLRKNNSEKAAEELIKATILLELADQGLTLEDAAKLKEEGKKYRVELKFGEFSNS